MLKILLVTCLLLFPFQLLFSQNEANIWYFGQNAGLDFNSGVPTPLLDGQTATNEGVASIADADGNLLFYTNGEYVYNKDHQLMQNGNWLLGDTSTSQAAIIVPKPLSLTVYYIFTLTLEGSEPGFRYSEVDTTLDDGLGAVTENKNIPLITPCTEHMTAIKHANGTDVWIIVHGYANNAFHAFLITPDGVNTAAVTSTSGLTFEVGPSGTTGCMKISPDGKRLSICNKKVGIQIFDFNSTTGTLSAPALLNNNKEWYGLEFSPSGDVLYATEEVTGTVVQYNLTATDISSSGTVVLTSAAPVSGGSLQLGPDGKIYKAASSFSYLSVIHNPDMIGIGCNAEVEGVYLDGPTSRLGLPNFIQSFFAHGIRANHLCHGDTTEFALLLPVPPDVITWDFGDGITSTEPAPNHTYLNAGTYTVTASYVIDGSHGNAKKTIIIYPLPVAHTPPDLLACDDNADGNEVFNLAEQEAVILGGQSQADYTVTYYLSQEDAESATNPLNKNHTNTANPQTIYARVAADDSGCYAITSFVLNVTYPVIDMPNEYLICEDGSTTITAPAGFESYLWSTGATTTSITVDEPGTYSLTVVAEHEGILCEGSKTITVSISPPPVIEDIIVQEWTNNQNSITIVPDGYEYSLDGLHFQDSPQFQNLDPGKYTIYIRDKNNCGMVKETVLVLMFPKFFTPNGDSHNESWNIKYAFYEPNMLVYVFDRYGKLIISFKGSSPGWDGTLNGSDLPASDYWFLIKRQHGSEYRGHFSLVR